MSEESQLILPASFVALYLPEGHVKPIASREAIAARYEFCEDLATMLVEHARLVKGNLGVTEDDVLLRIHRGLHADASGASADEARWVTCRLAELLEWPLPVFPKGAA